MLDQEKEMMERYIFEVVRRVPKGQRGDIQMELQGLIEDMYESGEGTVEAILERLGEPGEFAKRYRDENRYVIGPEYYDDYIWVLKIVLLGVTISAIVSSVVGIRISTSLIDSVIDAVVEAVVNFSISAVGAFGMVTFIFALLEYQKVKVDIRKELEWSVKDLGLLFNKAKIDTKKAMGWSVKDLRPVPDKRAMISRGDSLVGLIFIVILGGLFIFTPHLFGAYVIEGKKIVSTIPIFNMEKWSLILPVLLVSIFIAFLDEMVKLVMGCYCKTVMVVNVITGGLQILLFSFALKLLPIWNLDFAKDVAEQFEFNISSKGDIMYYWGTETISNLVLGIICLVTVIEVSVTIYKTIRYSNQMK